MAGFYIQQSDLEAVIPPDIFIQISDRDGSGVPTASAVEAAIANGEGYLHRFLARRYQLPLDITDAVLSQNIKPMAIDFAWAALYPRAEMTDPELLQRISDHNTYLTAIRDGKTDLPAAIPPPAASSNNQVLTSVAPRKIVGSWP